MLPYGIFICLTSQFLYERKILKAFKKKCSSLCLYITTTFCNFQDAILHKLTKQNLFNLQKSSKVTNNRLTNCKGQSYNDSKWGTSQSAPICCQKVLKIRCHREPARRLVWRSPSTGERSIDFKKKNLKIREIATVFDKFKWGTSQSAPFFLILLWHNWCWAEARCRFG